MANVGSIGSALGGLLGRPAPPPTIGGVVTVGVKPAVPATLLTTAVVFAVTQLVNLGRSRLNPTVSALIATVAGTIAGVLAGPGTVAPKPVAPKP